MIGLVLLLVAGLAIALNDAVKLVRAQQTGRAYPSRGIGRWFDRAVDPEGFWTLNVWRAVRLGFALAGSAAAVLKLSGVWA